ncbi:uncharacterized protein A1O9_07863 [Exophiala aquamarina CBS 119918]|uniref:Uncharacterized protein n=1 Tax=Exophiala aquamarina CBS 119918 TaxID=1182545 RepID=A0A072P993_9EURO|nr:uncharacterized protein A1O9_07863 [Exophiala aquamarina CBS 119918]KEF56282.1 hypothetical protein A1O9_07863 [Exophiala aquamarina CBS 119918]
MSCVLAESDCKELFDSIPDLVEVSLQWFGTSIVDYVVYNIFYHLESSGVSKSKDQSGPNWELLPPDLKHQAAHGAITEVVLRWTCILRRSLRFKGLIESFQGYDGALDYVGIQRQMEHIMGPLHLKIQDFYGCAHDGHLCLLTLHRKSFCFRGPALSVAISAVAHHGTEEEVRDLRSQLRPGAKMELVGFDSPLVVAVEGRRETILDILLAAGARVNHVNPSAPRATYTPLSIAVLQGETRIIHKLLQHGADPNLRFEGGRHNLGTAAELGFADIVELLLQFGADVLATRHNRGPKMAYDIALSAGHRQVAEILKIPTFAAKERRLKEMSGEMSHAGIGQQTVPPKVQHCIYCGLEKPCVVQGEQDQRTEWTRTSYSIIACNPRIEVDRKSTDEANSWT